MKKRKGIFIVLSLLLVITSCVDDEFDIPPINIPKVDFSANTTIAKLKYDFKKFMDTTGIMLDSIESDIIIRGIVVANDESGNFYKKLIIQDETGGIEIHLDKTSLYNEYRLGQVVYVKCKGLFIGNYRNLIQLGYKYNNTIGRIPEMLIKKHIFIDGLPGDLPQPKILNLNALKDTFLSVLCRFDNVYFSQAGETFVSGSDDATNRDLLDLSENKIIVRTSKYANFALNKIPYGTGTVIGILSIYNNEWQLFLRDLNDLQNFGGPAPYTLMNETFNTDPLLYTDNLKKWTSYSVTSNKNWYWSSQYQAMMINGYGGDAPSNDWLISPPIDLTGCQNSKLSFKTWTKFYDNSNPKPLRIFISTDYIDGDPTMATWEELNANLPAQNSATWTSSGDIDISQYQQKIRIAFLYTCTSGNSATQWEVDEVKIKTLK